MSAKHTQGRLTLGKWASASGGPEIQYVNGIGAQQVFHCQPMESADYIRNARRLVACWNACEGLETESLERIAPLSELLVGDYCRSEKALIEYERSLDAARALLREVERMENHCGIADHHGTTSGFDLLLGHIRSYLEACETPGEKK